MTRMVSQAAVFLPAPVFFILDVWRRAFAHPQDPRLRPARPRLNLAMEERFGHEPLERDASERMALFDAFHEVTRLFPGGAMVRAGFRVIVALFGVEFN